jgi:hypothetical protein
LPAQEKHKTLAGVEKLARLRQRWWVRSVCRRLEAGVMVQPEPVPLPPPAIKQGPITTSLVRLQFEVLILSQAQEYPASANLDRLVQRLPAFQVRQPAAPLNQLDHLVR